MLEQAISFLSRGHQLQGIYHQAHPSAKLKAKRCGVVIVVGGPQTKFGSHRQFVQLARFLAQAGVDVFRFDYTGAGDSAGPITRFTDLSPDIEAALNTFNGLSPELAHICLWGLCDAASAILLYLKERNASNIDSIFLLNPWVEQPQTKAKTILTSYYLKRLFTADFWQKVCHFNWQAKKSLKEVYRFHQQSREHQDNAHYIEDMRKGLAGYKGKVGVCLSGNDLTAAEFKRLCHKDTQWKLTLIQSQVIYHNIKDANHTFAQHIWKDEVARITLAHLNPSAIE